MRIDDYHFGHIDIAGRHYDADVIIFPNHVEENWWRKEGHCLSQKDLESVFAEQPEKLVIGTGYYGRMDVPQETIDSLRAAGVEVFTANTREAVEAFNRLQREGAVVAAALHLTC